MFLLFPQLIADMQFLHINQNIIRLIGFVLDPKANNL